MTPLSKTLAIIAFSGATLAEQVQAALHVEMSIPLDWVQEAATVASQACATMGFATTFTAVDQRAQPRVQLMREGPFPQTVQTSSRKEITTASRHEATAIIEAGTRMGHSWGPSSMKLAGSLSLAVYPPSTVDK